MFTTSTDGGFAVCFSWIFSDHITDTLIFNPIDVWQISTLLGKYQLVLRRGLIEKKRGKEDSCWVESVKSFIIVVGGGGEVKEGIRGRPRGLLLWRLRSCLGTGLVGIIKP